jgi:hypothetical protein
MAIGGGYREYERAGILRFFETTSHGVPRLLGANGYGGVRGIIYDLEVDAG